MHYAYIMHIYIYIYNEETFNDAIPIYQEALEKSGHKHKLEYEAKHFHGEKKIRNINRKVFFSFLPPPCQKCKN